MAVRVTTAIVDEASSYNLVTVAIAKDELGISGAASDAKLTRYIAAASMAASNYCNRVFPLETVTDTFDIGRARLQYHGEASLQATRWPVVDVTSVLENDVELVRDTDYRLDEASGLFYRITSGGLDRSWISTPVVITYNGGFDPIPADLQDAVLKMVNARWAARGRDPFAKSESIPGVRDVTFWIPTGSEAGNMTPDVLDVLESYRVPLVG
jgi:hypothetical protein